MTNADEQALFPVDADADAELERTLTERLTELSEQAGAANRRLAEFDVKRQPLADAVIALCDA